MKLLSIILFCLLLTTGCKKGVEPKENHKPIVVYREKANMTLADIAYDLLEFDKYEMALELVKDDTSALVIKMYANYGLGNIRDAIDYGILDLRVQDSTQFYEVTAELVETYEIFMESPDYAIHKLAKEYERCTSNIRFDFCL